MADKGAQNERIAMREAAACLQVGIKPPYRLRKQGKTAEVLIKFPREKGVAHRLRQAG